MGELRTKVSELEALLVQNGLLQSVHEHKSSTMNPDAAVFLPPYTPKQRPHQHVWTDQSSLQMELEVDDVQAERTVAQRQEYGDITPPASPAHRGRNDDLSATPEKALSPDRRSLEPAAPHPVSKPRVIMLADLLALKAPQAENKSQDSWPRPGILSPSTGGLLIVPLDPLSLRPLC